MTNDIGSAGRASAMLRRPAMVTVKSFTIDSAAAALSDAIELGKSNTLYGLLLDTGMTGTKITFQGSLDNSVFRKLSYAGAEYTLTVAAGDFVALDGIALVAPEFIKVRIGTSTGGTQQAAARTLKAVIGPVLE